jgi:hypothetical protein
MLMLMFDETWLALEESFLAGGLGGGRCCWLLLALARV